MKGNKINLKKKNKDKPEKGKKKKVRVMKVGVNRRGVILMWVLLIASVTFGIYKNFTAIDRHTVHEKETIKEKVTDTNAIEQFVKDYAEVYYSWDNKKESLEKRLKSLENYTTDELQVLNTEGVRADVPTCSRVTEVKVWNVETSEKHKYKVTFSVEQQITEGDKKKAYTSFYETTVYQETDGSMVIIRNPTIRGAYEKSDYEAETVENDGSVDANQQEEINEFLETFFKLYPTASEKELAYYVKEDALEPINNEAYVFSELQVQGCMKEKKKVRVKVNVTYLNQQTKEQQVSQFDLLLEKDNNWMIVK